MERQKGGERVIEPIKSFNKICGRLCVEMTGRLASPLSIGSGEDEYTDGDVVTDAQGEPYIPGTSLAGVMREYANAVKGDSMTDQLFGTPENGVPGSIEDRQSRIFIYDAAMKQAKTGIRDGVKLNERKTASHMGKYDLQFIEQDADIKFRIEILEREERLKRQQDIQELWAEDLDWIRLWQQGFNGGELRLGSKTRRGYGKIEIKSIRIKKFDMRDRASYMEWLDWDWDLENAFENSEMDEICTGAKPLKNNIGLEHCLEVPLHLSGTLLVRTYITSFARTENLPDYGQMTVEGKGKQAVIPGSSWAGAFRSHIAKIVEELGQLPDWQEAQKSLEPLFGTWSDTKEKKSDLCASRVIFEESVVEGGHGLPTARIAVDRFTGGTVQGALYEEVPWTGGTVRLRIRWKKDGRDLTEPAVCGLILWAVRDLQSGFLAIGGETSVGRGIFEPDRDHPDILLDGEVFGNEEQEESMQAAALWVQNAVKGKNMRRQKSEKV